MTPIELLKEARDLQQVDNRLTLDEAVNLIRSSNRMEEEKRSREAIVGGLSKFAVFTDEIQKTDENLYIFKVDNGYCLIKAENQKEALIMGMGTLTKKDFFQVMYSGQKFSNITNK